MSKLDVNLIPGDDSLNQMLLQVTRRLDEQETKHWLTMLSKAWNEGFDACRDEFDKQKADPGYPINRLDPYKAMMNRD